MHGMPSLGGSAGIEALLIDPGAAWSVTEEEKAIGFVDLDTWPRDLALALPFFPILGLGDPSHPLAALLDAVVEPPVSAPSLARQVLGTPKAAAIAMHVLRSIEGLPSDSALRLESLCFGLLQGSGEHAAWLARQTPPAACAPPGRIGIERRDTALHVMIDRPWARNAIDHILRDGLYEAFTLAALDPEIRSIVLRGTGAAFSVGADLEEFGVTRDPATAHLIRQRTLPALPLARCADRLDVHVQGGCVGSGLEMAAFAHRLTASPDAWFQLPELAMGIIPGAGGCVSVPRRIGRQRTALLILSGRRINAATALRWGLIDAIEERA